MTGKCPACGGRLVKHCELKACTWKKCKRKECQAFTNGKTYSKPLPNGGYEKTKEVSA